ncbi:MAG: HAMP domain-containing histidine kinase [Actinomycetota bacterium]|nr:HAMP domain-containing histidine kinase [Actinomycetota bacterium]
MNLNRVRLRLTLGYVGIFALIVLLLGTVAVVGFLHELTRQQDDLLTQEAKNQTSNLLGGENREILAAGSDEFGWIALELDGQVIDSDAAAPSLGLPSSELAERALQEGGAVSATIQGLDGSVRAVSMPMYEESGEATGMIQYARSLRGVYEEINQLILVLLPLTLGALGLSAIGGAYMAGRAVRPVREAFERQRSFIADASHELKTPLTLIRADAEVLRRGLTKPDDRELADDVLAETDKMTSVLSDLLLIARLDAGKLAVRQESFDLAGVISETTDRFVARAASEGIRLEARAPGKLGGRGDSERAAQILSVLLDNALRHTSSGGKVSVVGRAQDGFVEAVVEDTGSGISPEDLLHIFERFYRVDTARSRSSGGTGLGLAIARDLARAQNGELEAENAEDGGAVFRLKLPVG